MHQEPITMERNIKVRNLFCGIICCCTGLLSCSDEGGRVSSPSGQELQPSFVVKYTLPDSGDTDGRGELTRLLPVPSSNANENRVDELSLLFFEQDDYGNGEFVDALTATLKGGSIEKTDSIEVTMGNGTAISADRDYNVLVIANAHKYFAENELKTFCTGKTENRVKYLQAKLPEVVSGYYEIPDDLLLMTGTTTKEAGKDMTVDLLRAFVRIDVKIADDKTDEYILEEATIRNACSHIPLFTMPTDNSFTPLGFSKTVLAHDNMIRGGLYLPETFRSGLNDPAVKNSQSACVLVSCRQKDYTGSLTWYRVDIRLEADGTQYLRRNNAYTVVISAINSSGTDRPDDAYTDGDIKLVTVSIPTDWDVPDGVTPPEVDVH